MPSMTSHLILICSDSEGPELSESESEPEIEGHSLF